MQAIKANEQSRNTHHRKFVGDTPRSKRTPCDCCAMQKTDEEVEASNARTGRNIRNFLSKSGYSVGGSDYKKNIIVGATIWGVEYEDISIGAYRAYSMEKDLLDLFDVEIDERSLGNEVYYKAKENIIEKNLGVIGQEVYALQRSEGKLSDQVKQLNGERMAYRVDAWERGLHTGRYALHVGKMPELNGEGTEMSDRGSGEKARIYGAYYEAMFDENIGKMEMEKPFFRRKMFDMSGLDLGDAEWLEDSIKATGEMSMADAGEIGVGIAAAVASTLVSSAVSGAITGATYGAGAVLLAGAAGGAAGAAVGALIRGGYRAGMTAADVGTGYRNGDEAWMEFTEKTMIDAGTSIAVGAAVGALTAGFGGAFAEVGNVAAQVGVKILQAGVTATVSMATQKTVTYMAKGAMNLLDGGYEDAVLDIANMGSEGLGLLEAIGSGNIDSIMKSIEGMSDVGYRMAIENKYMEGIGTSIRKDYEANGWTLTSGEEWLSVGTSMLAAGVTSGMDVFSQGNLLKQGSSSLSSLVGGIAGEGTNYGIRRLVHLGENNWNIDDAMSNWQGRGMDLSVLGFHFTDAQGNRQRTGLLELELGGGTTGGARLRAGTGGVDIGARTLISAGKDIRKFRDAWDIRTSKNAFDKKNRDMLLAGYYYGGGLRETLAGIRDGSIGAEVNDEALDGEGNLARTGRDGAGRKRLTLGSGVAGMEDGILSFGGSIEEQLRALTVLAHEGERDGYTGAGNYEETARAVIAHTQFASLVMSQRGDVYSGAGAGFSTVAHQVDLLRTGGLGALVAYAAEHYDSDGDDWKLLVEKSQWGEKYTDEEVVEANNEKKEEVNEVIGEVAEDVNVPLSITNYALGVDEAFHISKTLLPGVSKALKTTGVILGAGGVFLGIGTALHQYNNGDISGGQAWFEGGESFIIWGIGLISAPLGLSAGTAFLLTNHYMYGKGREAIEQQQEDFLTMPYDEYREKYDYIYQSKEDDTPSYECIQFNSCQ